MPTYQKVSRGYGQENLAIIARRGHVKEDKFSLQKLRYERLSRKITAKTVAEALEISFNAYYRKEAGNINITVEELAVILDTLGIERSKAGMFY